MAKVRINGGGFLLISPKGKRFKDGLGVFGSQDEAVTVAKRVAERIAGEGRRDPVIVVKAIVAVKAVPPTTPRHEVTPITSA